jgi:predicted permease
MFQAFVTALLPVIFLAGLGAYLARNTDYLDSPALGQMVTNIGLPCLLLSSVLRMQMPASEIFSLAMATAALIVSMTVVTFFVLRVARLPVRYYISPLVNPNAGNLGIPVVFALVGEQGLAAAVVISSVVQISHFTLGVGAMSGEYRPKQLLKNAPVMALVVGLILSLTSFPVPDFAVNTLSMLGNITVPIMLLMLGQSIASLHALNKEQVSRLLSFAIYRPLIGTLIALGLIELFPLSPPQALALLLQSAMPVAVISYILSKKYGGPSQEIAGLIVLSTPVSFIMISLLWILVT